MVFPPPPTADLTNLTNKRTPHHLPHRAAPVSTMATPSAQSNASSSLQSLGCEEEEGFSSNSDPESSKGASS